jgi:hypothetical protein
MKSLSFDNYYEFSKKISKQVDKIAKKLEPWMESHQELYGMYDPDAAKNLEMFFYAEILPVQFVHAAFWETNNNTPNNDNYSAMISSGILDSGTDRYFKVKYDENLTPTENLANWRSNWDSTKGKIRAYAERQEQIEDAFGKGFAKTILKTLIENPDIVKKHLE